MTDDEWRTREARIAAEDARLDRLAAAERAVKDAAMACHHVGWQWPEMGVLIDACAALAKLEAK